MNFAQKVSLRVKRHMISLREAHDRRVARAEARAEAKLARAKSKAEREKIRAQLATEKALAQKELYEARAAAAKAKTALVRAKKEAGDVGLGSRVGASIAGGVKAYRRTVGAKRKAPARRVGRKKSLYDLIWG